MKMEYSCTTYLFKVFALQTKCYCIFVHKTVLLNEKVHNTLFLNSLLNFGHNDHVKIMWLIYYLNYK